MTLIKREDAIELCAEAQGRASTKSELKGISKVWQGLLKLPSAEADKLVRCEDCRYRNTWDNPRLEPQYYRCGMGIKFRDYGYVREDDYCPFGKRREEGEVEK